MQKIARNVGEKINVKYCVIQLQNYVAKDTRRSDANTDHSLSQCKLINFLSLFSVSSPEMKIARRMRFTYWLCEKSGRLRYMRREWFIVHATTLSMGNCADVTVLGDMWWR